MARVGLIALFLGRLSAQGNFQLSQLTVEGCRWRRSPGVFTPDDNPSGGDSDYVDVTAGEMIQLVM